MTKMTPALQNSTPDKFWKSRFRELRKFKAKHGHTKLSSSKEGDRNFYDWLRRQKQNYRAGELSEERMDLFDDLGVDCGVVKGETTTGPTEEEAADTAWPIQFKALTKFKKAHGHVKPEADDDKSLFDWVNSQRRLRRESKLSSAKCKRLEKLSFDWVKDERKKAPKEVKSGKKRVIKDYCPPRAKIEEDESGSPITYLPTYTTVYTVDLHDIIAGLTDKTMDVAEAVERLTKMARITE